MTDTTQQTATKRTSGTIRVGIVGMGQRAAIAHHVAESGVDAEVVVVAETTEAGRARYRTGVRIMLGALAVFALGVQVFQGEFLAPYDTWTGQAVLAGLAMVVGFALSLLVAMGRSRTPTRPFAPDLETVAR